LDIAQAGHICACVTVIESAMCIAYWLQTFLFSLFNFVVGQEMSHDVAKENRLSNGNTPQTMNYGAHSMMQ